jgi:hypothetical protein
MQSDIARRHTICLDHEGHAEFRRHSAVSAFSRDSWYCDEESILDAFTIFDVPELGSKPSFRLTTSWLTQWYELNAIQQKQLN